MEKKKRGRPPGSRNKPKVEPQVAPQGHFEALLKVLQEIRDLYTLDLRYRGIDPNPPNSGEGEVLTTDDAEVTRRIDQLERLSGISRAGFYVGEEPEGILNRDGTPRGEEVNIGPQLFGSGWGIGAGPEGAEESGTSTSGYRGTGREDPGDVPRQGSSKESEGESRTDSSPLSGGNSQERSGADSAAI